VHDIGQNNPVSSTAWVWFLSGMV